ncbi:hypothetical protein [Nostoc sp. CALU 1950]|uniref:hypothetical protein n=1 Tax=Nostoc sp. CALU 1950 TaxID=3104321 RepID=UPI003EBDF7AD
MPDLTMTGWGRCPYYINHQYHLVNIQISVKASKNKIYRNRGEIWLIPGIIFLGAAAIASFMIIIYAHNQSERQNQNSPQNATSPSVNP